METKPNTSSPAAIGAETLLAFARATIPGIAKPAPDHEPSPWGPVFRSTVSQWVRIFSRRHPGSLDWIVPHGPLFRDRTALAALHPQTPSPRSVLLMLLAQTIVERAEILSEVSGSDASEASKRGIIIVSGYVGRFVADVLKPSFRIPLKDLAGLPADEHPFPGWPPPPKTDWLQEELSGPDLVILGAGFAEAALGTFDTGLRRTLGNAAAELATGGAARMQ